MGLKEIYRKSWNVAIKHKALWVIGAAVLAFTGGGSSFFNYGNSFGNDKNLSPLSKGQTDFQPLLNYILNLAKSIPALTWVFLGLAVLIALIVGIAISVAASSWAAGSLVGGIEEALDGKNPTIKSSSHYGLKHLKSLAWLRLVPGLLLALALLAGILLSAILLSFSKVFGISVVVLIILATFIAIVMLTLIQVWASRIAVIEGKDGKEAFFEAWKLGKSNFLDMLGLGTVNCFAGCLVGCGMVVVLIPLGALGFGTFVATGVFSAGAKNYYALVPALSIVLLLVILVGVVITLVMSIYTVFNYSTWNVLYRQIRAKEKKGKKDGK